MNFFNWLKDLLLGSFISLANYFISLYHDAISAGLSPNWPTAISLCVVASIWMGSAFFSGTVAEVKGRNRLIHFLGGLAVPWVYPFIILFRLSKPSTTTENSLEASSSAVETDENKPDADSGEDDSEKTPQISQEYLRESATDDMGNSRGPFMFVFDDGKVLEAQRIVNCLPEHVVVEIIEKGTPRTIRFPYSKISSFVLKEEWDPENIPLMTKAPSRESKGTEKKEEKKNELGINVNLVSKLKKLSREEDSSKSSPEETAKLTMEMMSQSTHIGSYVLLKPATEIGGCRIISEIGKGGMGMVYLARHTRLDINVAVKVLSAKCEDEHDINISQRFLQEAKIAAKIRHPHLVSVMDAGKDEPNELFYIVMEYVDGGTVGDMIRKNGKISQSDALNIILAVSEALSAGQKFNIVHRDIKPDNIMLSSEGDIKLSDLGLAKINEPRMELHLTGVNMVLGSIPYMSPEQAKDFTKADFRSDVYSLGTTLYHMLTGNFPYTGDNPLALVMKAMNDPTPNPKDHCPEIDEEVAAACMKMMGKKPEDRFQTPEELIEEINRLSKKIST